MAGTQAGRLLQLQTWITRELEKEGSRFKDDPMQKWHRAEETVQKFRIRNMPCLLPVSCFLFRKRDIFSAEEADGGWVQEFCSERMKYRLGLGMKVLDVNQQQLTLWGVLLYLEVRTCNLAEIILAV